MLNIHSVRVAPGTDMQVLHEFHFVILNNNKVCFYSVYLCSNNINSIHSVPFT